MKFPLCKENYVLISINQLSIFGIRDSFNCSIQLLRVYNGTEIFLKEDSSYLAPAISLDMTSTHWNCWNTKNSWRISKWIRIDEDNLHSHISRSMHLAQNLVEKKNESTKKCDKKPNLFLDLQLSNLPNPKIQFFIGGGVWVYSRPSI